MPFLLDNLGAVAITGVVILILATIGLRRAETTRDGTRTYQYQRAQSELSNLIERDLTNAGIGTPSGSSPVQLITPTRLVFYGIVDPSGTVGLIEYRAVDGGMAEGIPVLRVERLVDGAAAGGGFERLARFRLTPLDQAGDPVSPASPQDARAVHVDLEWVLWPVEQPGAASRQAVRRAAWSTTIRPLGLQP